MVAWLFYFTRVPNISVPQGYNARHIKKHMNSIRVHYIKKENFGLGISEIKTPYGNKVEFMI
ncbi:transcriptional regulator [Mycoplasmopsis anatis]|uniref:Transcriptional regulator n=2 Tax=Mycoplasmopsis anatis TaxID=171279 RepID=A0A9Q3LB44_9BACT|nr:transcriptional regulator [Mycoplasmopsis anatis]MBW0595699.1 transcriptional regulator [Mycoplasmopsis anatis]MBW0596433.1 transcriptional regulator [Mycoplasmopsis anatis]MBW0597153.1 transcriptional regulator [Mycoplasmopsis anatis]MBW0597890.1 transcriptional regulator [Mycoplasmopsis anatis]